MEKIRRISGMVFLFLFIVGTAAFGKSLTADAAVSCKVNYVKEEIELTVGSGGAISTKSSIYVSIDKEKNWDRIEDVTYDSVSKSTKTSFDISSILSNKPVKIYFREKMEDASTEVELQGLVAIKGKTGVTASGSVINITNVPAGRIVEYRRGNGSQWRDITTTKGSNGSDISFNDNGNVGIYVNKYTITGMNFTFRLKATENDRVGKEVKVKVAKKANAPNIKVDGSKLSLSGLKANGSEYRFKENEDFKKAEDKLLLLDKLFTVSRGSVTSTGTSNSTSSAVNISQAGISVPIMGGTVEVRTAATDKKGASRSKYVVVPAQEKFDGAGKVTISITQKKEASLAAINISDASKDNPYEYTLLSSGSKTVDLTKQKWIAISKSGVQQLKKAGGVSPEDGAILLVRKKSKTDKTTKVVTPASTCYEYVLKL